MNLVSRIAGAARLLATGKLAQSTGFNGAQMQRRLVAWRAGGESINSLILQGAIRQASYPGGFYRYAVGVGEARFLVDDPRRMATGTAAAICLPAAALHLYSDDGESSGMGHAISAALGASRCGESPPADGTAR